MGPSQTKLRTDNCVYQQAHLQPLGPNTGQHQLSGNSAKSQDALGPTALRLRGMEPPNEFTLLVARETLATKMN